MRSEFFITSGEIVQTIERVTVKTIEMVVSVVK